MVLSTLTTSAETQITANMAPCLLRCSACGACSWGVRELTNNREYRRQGVESRSPARLLAWTEPIRRRQSAPAASLPARLTNTARKRWFTLGC